MADTGAPWNIPYAEPADLVRDWPALSEDVADAVAAGLDNASFVKQMVKTDMSAAFAGSVTGDNFQAITGYSVTITPSSTSSRVLLIGKLDVGHSASATEDRHIAIRMLRGSTVLDVATDPGSRTVGFFFSRNGGSSQDILPFAIAYLDSPNTTSAVTYSAEYKFRNSGGSTGFAINQTVDDSNSASRGAGMSTLIAVEVAG
jgi:hypothetical protein